MHCISLSTVCSNGTKAFAGDPRQIRYLCAGNRRTSYSKGKWSQFTIEKSGPSLYIYAQTKYKSLTTLYFSAQIVGMDLGF